MPILAQVPQPTSLEIRDVFAYQDVREDGDQMYLVTYYIVVATNETATDLFTLRLFDEGDVELAQRAPFAYYAGGYGLGVVAFYLGADDAPDWQSAVTIEIAGDPLEDWEGGSPPTTSTNVISWETGASATDLSAKILTLAGRLQQSWDTILLTTVQGVTILNDIGKTYFVAVVPYLSEIAPYVMGQYTFTPSYPTEDDRPSETTYATWLEQQIDGTILDISPVARSLGIPRGALIASVYYTFVVIFFVLLISKKGLKKGMMLLAWPVVIGGAFFGVPLVITILGGFFCLISTGWLFYKAVA